MNTNNNKHNNILDTSNNIELNNDCDTILSDNYTELSEEMIDNLLMGINLNVKVENKKKACISCKSENLVIDNVKGYLVCDDCAVINMEFLNENPEFSKEDENSGNNSSRYGCPSNYFFPKSSLGTKIAGKGFNRVSALQRQGQMPYREKSLLDVLDRIQSKCKKYLVTQTIIDSAKILYKKVNDSKHIRGNRVGKNMIMRCINRRSMIAACVFYACKMQKEPRSPKEIADIYDLEIKHVHRGCRKILDYIDLNSTFYQIKNSQSSDFIERLGKKLFSDPKYIAISKDVCNNIHNLDIASTHEPPSVAAGCILLVSNTYNLNINKKDISTIFEISDVTISKTYRKIFPYHKIILNNKVTELVLKKKNLIVAPEKVAISESNLVLKEELKKELLKDTYDCSSESSYTSDEDSITKNEEIVVKKKKEKVVKPKKEKPVKELKNKKKNNNTTLLL